MIDRDLVTLSIRRQCERIGLNRSSLYCNWPQKLDHVLRWEN